MTKILQLLILAIAALLQSCGGNQFKITFQLPADVNANYRVVYYASDKRGGYTVETVAAVEQGKGEISGQTVNPTILLLYDQRKMPVAIYVKRGDKIKIDGPSAAPASWTVGGNVINEKMSEWRNENAQALDTGSQTLVNKAIAKTVISDPESEIAPLLLLTSFSRNLDETLFRQLWQRIPDSDGKQKWTSIMNRNDVPVTFVRTPAKLQSLIARSHYNGADTIRPASAKATLLFFWNNGFETRKETFDSINTLSRQYPDSASRIIADICLDPDSVVWVSPLKRDSLQNVARLWMPQGLADKALMNLQVLRTPSFMVVAPDGNQRYRGQSFAQADSVFRTLMPKPKEDKK